MGNGMEGKDLRVCNERYEVTVFAFNLFRSLF